VKGGLRAVIVYALLLDLSARHLIIIDVMQSMNCLFALIDYTIKPMTASSRTRAARSCSLCSTTGTNLS
jgi:hypothetical protein